VGKATCAYRLARALLCYGQDPQAVPADLSVAPEEPVFRKVAAQSHPDLIVLRRPWDEKAKKFKSTLPVDEVRRLSTFFGRHASAGGWRIAIVDKLDDMNVNAANALLKVLEEPPERALLILISDRPGSVLPTIRSRCRRMAFLPLRPDDLAGVLMHQMPDLESEDVDVLTAISGGSAGRALSLASEDGVQIYRNLVTQLARLPAVDVPDLYAFAGSISRPGADQGYRLATTLLVEWVQDVIRNLAAKSADPTMPQDPQLADLQKRLGDGFRLDHWLSLWENVRRLIERADAVALDRRQVIVTCILNAAKVAEGRALEPAPH
jgi:DNA polymerase-3 subunit delta'